MRWRERVTATIASLRATQVNRRGMHKAAIGAFIGALVVIILGLSLLPAVVDYVNNASAAAPSQTGLLNIIPTFWVIGVLVFAAGLAYVGVKSS